MGAKKNITAFIVGFIFALGLGISGMTQPQKVVGFLDIFGHWNPALGMVMVGAILFHGLAFYRIRQLESPLLGGKFQIPTSRDINGRLLIGAGLFGVGWGMAGFCPGPAITSLASGNRESFIFVLAMLLGMGFFRMVQPLFKGNS